LKPLEKIGILDVKVATMQAISGAGYDLRAMSILENVIPYIPGEEEKMEREGLKVLGKYEHDGRIRNASFSISASCHRVPVLDGHTEAIWVEMREGGVEEAIYAFEHFKNEIDTPTAPEKPIIVCEEEDRPQPRLDRDAGDGMSVTVGRIRSSGDGIKYIALGHNTIRGAAGASVLNAELLVKGGYI
jgi:aspartate-semialdehyde dehydrogenase